MAVVCFYDKKLVVEEVTQKVTLNMIFFLLVLRGREELLQA